MSKRVPALFGDTDMLDLDALLWAELETYAAEESRVAQVEAARRARNTDSSSGGKVAGRRSRRR